MIALRYTPGTHLADRWGSGPTGTFATREEAEEVRRACPNAEWLEVVEPDQPCERCVFVETPGGKCICREVGK